jgi:hypothetical protein
MLLIILLGAVSKLAVVSAECNIGTTNKTIDWTNVSYSITLLNIFYVNM